MADESEMTKEEVISFLKNSFKNKKVQWALAIILFSIILFFSVQIRLGNVDIMKDSTTGKYTSNDLDSLYFYRIAETKMNNGGVLPEFDEMRSPGYNTGWLGELLPDLLIWNYKALHLFNSNVTFDYACLISAPIFFAIGLILFFILSLLLTKSKITSVIASAFLGFAPGFLFRSVSGFYDHDHVGVFAIFALAIVSYFALKNYEKNWKNSVLLGLLVGIFTSFVYVNWTGAITFVFVFLPVAFFMEYLFNNKEKKNFLLFYLFWLVASIIFVSIFGMDYNGMLGRIVDSTGIAVLFVLGFAVIDFIFEMILKKKKLFEEKYEKLVVLASTVVIGLFGLIILGKNPIELFKKAWSQLIYPFFGDFSGRLSSTVAENAQPYLTDLISQNGDIIFWMFMFGLVLISINFIKNSKSLKNKFIVSSSMSLMFVAILFSRYSSSSLFNGENFISQAFYLIGALSFAIGIGYVYYKDKFKIGVEEILLFSVGLTVALNARAASRSFFLITPFIILIASYSIAEFVKKLFGEAK